MPSTVGHALAGVAAGYLVGGAGFRDTNQPPAAPVRSIQILTDGRFLAFGALGALPDVDLFFGVHSAYTHSIGATVLAGLLTAMVGPQKSLRFAFAAAAAYGSHVLLDWLGSDTVAPLGVMALWPIDTEFYLSDRRWFTSVCREYWLLSCVWHNVVGVMQEVVILGPLAVGSVLRARRSRET